MQQQEQALNQIQSMNILKNLLRISISELCYLRNLFPSNSFTDSMYAGLHVKRLQGGGGGGDDVLKVIEWIEQGVFEALAKEYLDSMIMDIITPDSITIESYVYQVNYTTNSIEMNDTKYCITASNAREQAIVLMRNLIKMTNVLPPLPENRMISMRLKFTMKTPKDWTPSPHFKRTILQESLVDEFDQSFGTISTRYHHLKILLNRPTTTNDTTDSQTTCINESFNTLSFLAKNQTIDDNQFSKQEMMAFQKQGVISATKDGKWNTIAYDPILYPETVYETHGHARRTISIEKLAKLKKISPKAAECILLRMEYENLIECNGTGNGGFKILKTKTPYVEQLLVLQKKRSQWGAVSPIIQLGKKQKTMHL